ncbi:MULTISPECIES: peptidoglycan DD-metalloendopeptidase family protein [unclassified Shewanella]|uniref:murein hydrolase activator EnvC family protein n=1 Tax=unclassified Shewanella TaxID=196818 RepID=UPI0018E48D3F|nr:MULTISPECIES: peptidoglycan DD-metalloendopeptidase family protein [unclassified Shewanella]MDO6621107.1 peptidoglycan DD-metalloendopeptidase family protein [Shewanella sp. 6_MG-2023]MDO6640661.1 peptidoglycan DD-metalloendopeptidase family protein [Shewanella sp. 5_MG-2023]MDO6678793.1 peptidoglycan DD-metalloendopeptidase family protein [Shewanella sp. 4_MG-2023]MDO6777575.1 peptidoglycan DD-metalloendopeptidase family protein [Shewanella sp. 3_MG-2023]
MKKRLLFKASMFAGLVILTSSVQSADLGKRQSELKSIQAQINQQQSSLKDTSRQREKLISLLKRDEQAISNAAQKVNQTQNSLSAVNTKLRELDAEKVNLDTLRVTQQKTLSKQLSSAYLAGNHDYSKMMLNQQNPATVERMLAYYQYLNNARIKAITSLKTTIEQLELVKVEQVNEQQKLNSLILEQQKQAKQLAKEQSQRQQTLAQIQRTLTSKGAELEQLQIEEASLKHLIEQAVLAAKNSPSMDGLAKLRGKLKWPTKGRVSSKFGSSRSGQISWKGAVIAAPEGQTITAIAHGTVIYSDWLRGFGMVMVIDHGEGYMSLYGHAQSLLIPPGETVKKGESIALVGSSGGQTESGLYFEIRHKGQAINPARYCR